MRAVYAFTYCDLQEGEEPRAARPGERERHVLAASLNDAAAKAVEWLEHDSPAEYRDGIELVVTGVRLVAVVDWPCPKCSP